MQQSSFKEMFAQQGDLFAMDVTKGNILRQCAIHPRRPHSHDPSTQTQPKVVQEVQAKGDTEHW